MKTPPSIEQEEQLTAQLRKCFSEGKKDEKDGGLQAAMYEQLERFLCSRSKAQAMFQERENDRKMTIEMIQLPTMKKVR